MFLSAGFVCLMLAISMVLFLGQSNEPIVDSQNAQMEKTYDLQEMDIDKAEIPLSLMYDLSLPGELEDPEMLTDVELRELAKSQDLPDGQVPEPATAALLIVGGMGLVTRFRRKRG